MIMINEIIDNLKENLPVLAMWGLFIITIVLTGALAFYRHDKCHRNSENE